LVMSRRGRPAVRRAYQVDVALALPAAFDTVTTNVWVVVRETVTTVGDVQGTAGAPSTEQVVFVGAWLVLHANRALVVPGAGSRVNATVGTLGSFAVTVHV